MDYYALPMIVLAVVLGQVALVRADAWRRVAKRGLLIAYGSLAGLALLFAALLGASSVSSSH